MRLLGIPLPAPQALMTPDALAAPRALAARALGDLAAVEAFVRSTPGQIERILRLGEEVVAIGYRVLEIGERLDARAAAVEQLGERLDARAAAIERIGERLDGRAAELLTLGEDIGTIGGQIDVRGAEVVQGAEQVSRSAHELMAVLPALERALDLATPLEGAIDRFGRLVDRFPGSPPNRRRSGPRGEG